MKEEKVRKSEINERENSSVKGDKLQRRRKRRVSLSFRSKDPQRKRTSMNHNNREKRFLKKR